MPRRAICHEYGRIVEGSVGPHGSGQGEIDRKFIRLELRQETRMAQIISLPDTKVRAPRRAPKDAAGAKILLFTGVRYERLDVPPVRRKSSTKRIKNT
jgi:hypothetical protein